ncbi:MAG: hypothetical protein FJX68_12650 [Alphaproteobacteria bacterium]|nr:hypothetical protein [Alphaproteobacteria bacterium]
MCAPDPPPPPDYTGAATAQGAANVEAARATAKLSNPNIVSPYGKQTVTFGVNNDPDQALVTQTFSPEQQALYNRNVATKFLLGDLGLSGATQLKSVIGRNLDLAPLGPAPASSEATRQQVFNAMTARTDRELAEAKEAANSQLIAQGIGRGTDAYGTEMRRLDERGTDARQRAELASYDVARGRVGQDAELRRQALAEILAQRQTPLNEATALMSGSQVSNPFAGGLGYQAGATTAPVPIFAATQQQGLYDQNAYNQQVGSYNNLMSGLFGIGAAGARGAPFFFR